MKQNFVIVALLFFGTLANGQSLQSFLDIARENNPKLKAIEMRYAIGSEKVNEANWLPNTEFGAGYFISEPETRTGAQRARFSVRQMLPWFGTKSQREKLAESMAETEYADYMVARRQLELQVAQSYYVLYGLQAKQEVLDDNIRLLKNYETLALTALEVGQASAVVVLRLQIRQNKLQEQKEVIQQAFYAEQAAFNALLNRDLQADLVLVPSLAIPATDPVLADSLLLNPELLRFDTMYQAVQDADLVNQKEQAPMVGFGLDYIPVSERPDMTFDDNGKDIVMPMVSLSLPIFSTRYASRTRQNEMRREELAFQKQERLNALQSMFAKAEAGRRKARISYNTQTRNLERAKNAEEILIKSYETGTLDFRDVLEIQELQLDFQLERIEAVEMYYNQSAILHYLSG